MYGRHANDCLMSRCHAAFLIDFLEGCARDARNMHGDRPSFSSIDIGAREHEHRHIFEALAHLYLEADSRTT